MYKKVLILICFICDIYSRPSDEVAIRSFDNLLNDESSSEVVLIPTQVLNGRVKRYNARKSESYRWPNKTVPYRINMTYYRDEHAEQFDKAIQILHNVTCVRFVNHTNETDFVTITGDTDHCSSKVGRRGGEQFIKLINSTVNITIGNNCFKIASIHHEIMHLLGFFHAHKSANRDDYIRIIWENVIPDRHYKLEKRTDYDELSDFGVAYDVDSILHYSKTAFSKNGENTIETIDASLQERIGQRDGLSVKDIERINRMYQCDEF